MALKRIRSARAEGGTALNLREKKINYKINFSKEERSSKSVSCRSQVDFHEIETSESMGLKNLFGDGDLRHLFHQNPGDQSRSSHRRTFIVSKLRWIKSGGEEQKGMPRALWHD